MGSLKLFRICSHGSIQRLIVCEFGLTFPTSRDVGQLSKTTKSPSGVADAIKIVTLYVRGYHLAVKNVLNLIHL